MGKSSVSAKNLCLTLPYRYTIRAKQVHFREPPHGARRLRAPCRRSLAKAPCAAAESRAFSRVYCRGEGHGTDSKLRFAACNASSCRALVRSRRRQRRGVSGRAGPRPFPPALAGDWLTSPPAVLRGSQPPVISGSFDEGAAPANQLSWPDDPASDAVGRCSNRRSPRISPRLQDPSSPLYHQWLSASSFADAYSVSASDAATVSRGFPRRDFRLRLCPQAAAGSSSPARWRRSSRPFTHRFIH